uniref:Uncharacterized protein n=1 Tax=Romanomermis culicivorax TaxID=13658 RepID=A0A915I1K2_ROMCU
MSDSIVTTCIMLVGNANSCVNPWIYLLFNYKRIFKALCPSSGFSPATDRSHVKYAGNTTSMCNNGVGCGRYSICEQTSVISDCDSRKKSSLLIYTAGQIPNMGNELGSNNTLLANIRRLEQNELQDTSDYNNRNRKAKRIFRIR